MHNMPKWQNKRKHFGIVMSNEQSPFLLIRGLMREQRHWGEFVGHLQANFPERPIITLDIPGNGRLFQQQSPNTIAGMTDALRAQLSTPGSPPLTVIALSMGGMITLDWMNRYPHEINAGVLINTSLRQFSPFYQRMRCQNYRQLLAAIWLTPVQREALILTLTANQQQYNTALLQQWQQWQAECPVSSQNAYRQLLAAARTPEQPKPSQPLLLLTSQADRLVDYQCTTRIQQAWGLPCEIHTTAGHDLSLDDPAWVCSVVKQWLQVQQS